MSRTMCAITCGFFCLVSCGGLKFAKIPLTSVEVPQEIKERGVYSGHQDLDPIQLAGTVVFVPVNDSARVIPAGRFVDSSFEPKLVPINKLVYQSLINRGWAAQASYLTSAAELNDSQVMEVVINDLGRVGIPFDKLQTEKLHQKAKAPLPEGMLRGYVIVNVYMSSMEQRVYHEISGNTKGAVGIVIGFGGKVYNSDIQFASRKLVGLTLVPLSFFKAPEYSRDAILDSAAVMRAVGGGGGGSLRVYYMY